MLKVLMISNLPTDLSQIKGGVESAVINLLTGLSKLRISVNVISLQTNIKYSVTMKFSENISIQYIPAGFLKNYFYYYLIHGRRETKKIINFSQPDIIHLQGTGPQLMLLKYKNIINIIVTQHGIMKEEKKYQIGLKKFIQFHIKSIIETIYLPKVKNIIFISEYNKKFVSRSLLKNSIKIPNAINYNYFKINQSKNVLNKIIYVGAINKRKGLINILKAIQLLKNKNIIFDLDIIGGFTNNLYKGSVEKYLHSHSIKTNVKFHGWQSHDYISKIMESNCIFILPSNQETLPVSIAEAMAAGLVVIANDVGGISEMFIDKYSGFLYKNNAINELVKILENLYNNSTLLGEISANAKALATKLYNPDIVAKTTLAFYNKIHK